MSPPFDPHGLSRRTITLTTAALVVTVVHHAGHVLRVDHSGWPFKTAATPFTLSLLACPMILFALFGTRRLFWGRWTLLAIGTALTLVAHSMVESPRMQCAMRASDCSLDPSQPGVRNLLDWHSPPMGVVAVTVSMLLDLLALVSTASMAFDAWRASAGASPAGKTS